MRKDAALQVFAKRLAYKGLGRVVATKDYARIIRSLPELLAPEGYALLCPNAPELDSTFFQNHTQESATELRFVQCPPNPDTFADASPERALKAPLYQGSSCSVQPAAEAG